MTEAEKWPVGVTAHHLASVLEPICAMIKAVAAGQAPGDLSMEMIDEMNARHARDFAGLHPGGDDRAAPEGHATAAATIRGLSDAELASERYGVQGHAPDDAPSS